MHFLVFESKRLSYDSSWCFMEMIQRCLKKLGAEVTIFQLEADIESQEKELTDLCSMDFDGIFDVNSILPSVKLDEEYYLNCFDAPFYQLIVDHPMHVHPSLKAPLKNHIVLCLDRQHKEYLEKYYPQLQKVYCMPFGGIPAEEFQKGHSDEETDQFSEGCFGGRWAEEFQEGRSSKDLGEGISSPDDLAGRFPKDSVLPMEERPFSILFPGTYTPLDYCWRQMDSHGEHYGEIADAILQDYRQGSTESIDALFYKNAHSDENFFTMKMYKARFVDRYIRQWYRDLVIKALLRQKITVDVVGFRWEMYQGEGKEYLRIHKPRTYGEQLAMLGQSRMVLNVQPLFQDGPHDRVLNAMINHSVAVTDSCRFLRENFSQGKELFLYDKNQPEAMAEWARLQLENPLRLEEIAQQGYQKVSEAHTWYHRIKEIPFLDRK